MALNRLTVDVSDGNNGVGAAFGELYQILNSIPANSVITEIDVRAAFTYAPVKNATTITSYALAAAYPFNVTLQFGPAGFTTLPATRGNYANSLFMDIVNVPTTTYAHAVLNGSSDMFELASDNYHYSWIGELNVTVPSDLWLQTYAGHQASPQLQFQQDGTVNVYYNL